MLHCDPYAKNSGPTTVNKLSSSFVIQNEKGLHTRPSTELVKCASKFSSSIFLTVEDMTVNAKSILGILMLAASKGTKIVLEAEGDDAEDAIEAIVQLAENKFYMSY